MEPPALGRGLVLAGLCCPGFQESKLWSPTLAQLGSSNDGVGLGCVAAESTMEMCPWPHIMGHCGQRARSVTSLLLGHLDPSAKLGFGDRALLRALSPSSEEIALEPGGVMSMTLYKVVGEGGPLGSLTWSLQRSQLPECKVVPLSFTASARWE